MRNTRTNKFIKSMLDNNGNYLSFEKGGLSIGFAHGFKEAVALIDMHLADLTVKVRRRMDGYEYGVFNVVSQNVTEPQYGADFIDRRWALVAA